MDKVEVIQKDLRNGDSISDVCKKHNLSFKELCSLMQGTSSSEYCSRGIRKSPSHGYILKVNRHYIGTFDDYNNAVKVRNHLKEKYNGDFRCRDKVFKELDIYPNAYFKKVNNRGKEMELPQNVYLTRSGKFQILKGRTGCTSLNFHTYNNLEDALKIREKLVECDWDKSQLPRIKKELGVVNSSGW